MNFGILSTAGIGLDATLPAIQSTDHEALAIASRDADRAEAVARERGVERSYGSYEALLDDPDLDAVYVPLPNGLHAEWTKRAADAGLHVLCEKPLAADAAEARDVGEYCEDAGVTLMEAFMYRYHPRTERAVEIAREELGDVRSVDAAFTFRLPEGADDIRIDPDLAGGSVMDVGCYAVDAARTLLGEPETALARTADTRGCGVDTQLTGVFQFGDGATARVHSGFDTAKTQYYRAEADDGWLEVREAFDTRGLGELSLSYAVDGREATETFQATDPFRAEVEHFARCVETGETPRTNADAAVRNMRAIDALKESARTDEVASV